MPDQDTKLEQRVKTLEYELKILKNEIQKTLLEIQEQILVHYYPTLRAEDSTPGEELRQNYENIQQRKSALAAESGALPPASKMPAAPPVAAAAEPAPAIAKPVSLDELRRGGGTTRAATPAPVAPSPAMSAAPAQPGAATQPGVAAQPAQPTLLSPQELNPVTPEQQATVMALSSWVTDTAQKIGGERTARLIEVCNQKRVVGPQYGDLLKRLSVFINTMPAPESVPVNEFLNALVKLDEALGRQPDVDRALALIEEMKLG
jgi:hypothetical protein